jgi:hypothetical protein
MPNLVMRRKKKGRKRKRRKCECDAYDRLAIGTLTKEFKRGMKKSYTAPQGRWAPVEAELKARNELDVDDEYGKTLGSGVIHSRALSQYVIQETL